MYAPLSLWTIVRKLGGPGLIALGIVDASLVPLPGSLDALTIVLASASHQWWPYYALMATAGTVVGGYVTFRIGRRGGQEALDKRFGKKKMERVYRRVREHGFGTLFLATLLPPPVPLVPFVLAVGALDYPKKRFLTAFGLGRAIRYAFLAWASARWGSAIIHSAVRYRQPVLWTFVALGVIGGAVGIYLLYRHRHHREDVAQERLAA